MAHQGIFASQWAPADHGGANTATPTLNSAIPSFQPNGSEMQRYQAPRTTGGMKDLQQYIVGMNVSHINDVVRLQRATGKNEQDIENLYSTFKTDMSTLEKKIYELETSQAQLASPTPQYTAVAMDYSPTDDMLNRFCNEELADAYVREAEDKEEIAQRLREQAAILRGAKYQAPQMEMLENGPMQDGVPTQQVTRPVAFACCEVGYPFLEEMRHHFEQTHVASLKAETAATDETPTHVPARRPGQRPSRSRALPIKAPQSFAPRSEKSKADSAVEIPAAAEDVVSTPASIPAWAPVTVRNMKPVDFEVPKHKETFTLEFLRNELGGDLWCSGFYFESGNSILKSKSYWLLDSDYEPFIPEAPGQHGAKLTPFFNDTPSPEGPDPDHYMDVPVFIKEAGTNEYRYYGQYGQTRYSDKVGYDCINDHIPAKTLRQWADELSQTGRPQWVTNALINHFWPLPKYLGPFPTDSAINTPATFSTAGDSSGGIERRVAKSLESWAKEAKDHEKKARLHASLLTSDALFQSFQNADSDIEPGLRLWWEYLECVNYDTGFYNMLVTIKNSPKLKRRPTADVGGKNIPSSNIENVPNESDINEEEMRVIPQDDSPVILNPVHSPPPNPKKLQKEQWANVDHEQAELDAKKPTKFTKIRFNDEDADESKKLKTMQNHLHKADDEWSNTKGKTPVPFAKSKNHTAGTKPWEKKNDDGDGKTASGWQGGGDIEAAKAFNATVQDGRWKTGASATGRGGGRRGVAPHHRRK